jgi:hypothetical protein
MDRMSTGFDSPIICLPCPSVSLFFYCGELTSWAWGYRRVEDSEDCVHGEAALCFP